MKKCKLNPTLLVLVMLLSISSQAATVDDKDGLWLFGGIGLGLNRLSTSARNATTSGSVRSFNEVGKMGYSGMLRSALSFYTNEWVFDLGLDYSYTRFSYSNYDPDPLSSGSSNNTTQVSHTMTIKNFIIDILPRYQMNENFQIGPLLQLHMGSDVGHSELENVKKGKLFYGGIHGNYEAPMGDKMLMRLGLQGLMSLNEGKRRNLVLNAVFDLGFALTGASKEPVQEVAQEEPAAEELINDNLSEEPVVFEDFQDDIPSAVATEPGQIVVRLPSDKFLFDTAMSHIRSPKTRNYLRDYGKILAANTEMWEKIRVEGHTDNRGTRRVNKELSTGRARTVYNHLKEGGVPPRKMTYVGRGFDEPADPANNAQAWAKNRRVELVISGVNATPEMLEQLNSLNVRYGYASEGRR